MNTVRNRIACAALALLAAAPATLFAQGYPNRPWHPQDHDQQEDYEAHREVHDPLQVRRHVARQNHTHPKRHRWHTRNQDNQDPSRH